MNVNGQPTRTITADATRVEIIDQTALPHAFVTRRCARSPTSRTRSPDAGARGAPDRRGGGVRDVAGDARGPSDARWTARAPRCCATRPTAVNLRWALDAMVARWRRCRPAPAPPPRAPPPTRSPRRTSPSTARSARTRTP
jgi:methylthioribose-1-phosphate isomerase